MLVVFVLLLFGVVCWCGCYRWSPLCWQALIHCIYVAISCTNVPSPMLQCSGTFGWSLYVWFVVCGLVPLMFFLCGCICSGWTLLLHILGVGLVSGQCGWHAFAFCVFWWFVFMLIGPYSVLETAAIPPLETTRNLCMLKLVSSSCALLTAFVVR